MVRRRSLALFLLLALIVPTIVACGDSGTTGQATTAPTTASGAASPTTGMTDAASPTTAMADASPTTMADEASPTTGMDEEASPTAGADDEATPAAGGEGVETPEWSEIGTEIAAAYNGEYKGKVVIVDGPFADQDAVRFNDTVKDFEDATGIDIQYIGNKQFEGSIAIRVDGGNPPDIADFPQPGLLASFVRDGKVVDVSPFINQDWLKTNYNQSWLDMSMMEGPSGEIMAGVWGRANAKSLVWYPKAQFDEAGYEIPETWADMQKLMDDIVADGDTPWCIGIESEAATGWPATDWMEEFMLRTTSLENYDKWTTGELPFNSPEVKKAAEEMSKIWFEDKYVYGGRASIVSTSFGDAPGPMFENPAKCWLHKQGNFITTFFPEDAKAGEDYDFFYLPGIDEQYGKPVLVAGDIFAMFNDRPEVRAVMQYFSTAQSMKRWIEAGGAISPHNDSSLDWYSNDVDRGVAEIIQEATSVRFDGSDLMPGVVGAGTFWKGMTDYVSGSVDLDTALEEIQAGWANVEK